MQDKELLTFFGSKVQQIRTHKGLSQETLAELTDLDRTYISSIERGRRNVSLINIYRLITALDCQPHELFPVKGEAL
ncbi:DNA-binding transcriptional regulator, XRE-family HTH domain [Thiothrix caldifontis]|uniref:DNA-binding transcriptional regulator, XRE-family HTH domain n=1 Tax=Thiothrix caldifontis TaxID=525918 RepID=A0A1H4GSR2_9GAMM|nr:helix-turn-helix transcriptional regulator [Thiothrix caldifontis]SEB11898.1 DNA-binding transcriptional regulator, XRE-family HTH domain [Thiothrix caldifontis]